MTTVNCPTCETAVTWSAESPFRPFCSKRCKLIDLGDWADESHTIAGPPAIDPLAIDEFDLPLNDEFFKADHS